MSPRAREARPRRARRGNAVWTALMILVLIGFTALALDIGNLRKIRAELQVAADASSHAAASKLDGTPAGLVAAQQQATLLGLRHRANGEEVLVGPEELTFGIWDGVSFTPSNDAELINASRVQVRRPDVATFFARALGRQWMSTTAAATGVRPEPTAAVQAECFLPLAVPLCRIDNTDADELAEMTLVLNPTDAENVGWARPHDSPNANNSRQQIRDCETNGTVESGDDVGLMGGVANSALQALAQEVQSSSTEWDSDFFGPIPEQLHNSAINESRYGHTLEAPIMVFDGGPEYCEGEGNFTGFEPLVGFAWGVVWDVAHQGPAEEQNIRMRINAEAEELAGTRGGQTHYAGVLGEHPPRLVQ